MGPESDLAQVYKLIDQQRPNACVPILEEVLSRTPRLAEARYLLGYVHFVAGDVSKAEMNFEKALSLDPNQANAAYYLGEIAASRRDDSTALHYYQRALEIYPQHLAASEKLGLAQTAPRGRGSPRPVQAVPVSPRAEPATAPASGPEQPTINAAQGANLSLVMRDLRNDPAPAAKSILELLGRLNMSVRPRLIPHILPTILLGVAFTAIVGIGLLMANPSAVHGASAPHGAQGPRGAKQKTGPSHETHSPKNTVSSGSQVRTSPSTAGGTSETNGLPQIALIGLFAVWLITAALVLIKTVQVTLTKYTFSDARILIVKGFIRRRENYELYRVVDIRLRETLLTKMSGDGILTLSIEHGGGKMNKQLTFKGLAKFDELTQIHDNLREVVLLLRSGNWGKGIIY
jgi:hypothetical protein